MLEKKILIIDDEPDTVTYLSTWLEDHGYQTYAAFDGEEGLQAILKQRPDLVLLDLKMPNQTGIQLYKRIMLDSELKNLPVIFITGLAAFHIFDDELQPLPEPVACIDKPFDLQALHAVIRSVFA